MNLYLMRHGEPKPGDALDVSRELSDLGVKQVEQMAAFMVRQVGRVDTVITSPYVCAMQTAAIMAKALGSPVIADTTGLQPMCTPAEAWDEIERLAQQSGDVLVVMHDPLITEFLFWLMAFGDESSNRTKFQHGAVACLEDPPDENFILNWFVTPQIIARDEAETEVLEAARELAEHLNTRPRAAIVDPLIAKLQAVTAGRFRAQKKHVLKALAIAKPHLVEAIDPSGEGRIDRELVEKDKGPQTVPPVVHHAVTAALAGFAFPRFATVFTSTTGQAHEGGLAEGADMIGVESEEAYDRTAAMLAGELDQTTEERIGDALRDVFGLGKGYDGLIEAVSGVFDDAITSRAVTTGESEISAAWNKGVADAAQSATDAGQNIEKRWSAEDDACEEICQPNADQDWIDFDDIFDSGDDQPPGHPNAVLAGSTFISYGKLHRMVAAEYDGPAIELFAGKNWTTIGPNHPMLTTRGMVPAKLLDVGDQLVYDLRAVDSSLVTESDLDQVVLVENAFASLSSAFGNALITASADDLHGDAIFCEQEIQVVFAKRKLLSERESFGIENLRYHPLVLPDVKSQSEARSRLTDEQLDAFLLSSSSRMGWAGVGHIYSLRTIQDIREITFKGMAFDASTETELYCSDGFVVSNCRCSLELRAAK